MPRLVACLTNSVRVFRRVGQGLARPTSPLKRPVIDSPEFGGPRRKASSTHPTEKSLVFIPSKIPFRSKFVDQIVPLRGVLYTSRTRLELDKMPSSSLSDFFQNVRRSISGDGTGLTDGELLNLFLEQRDASALAALIRRHGSMVWGVCLRALRNEADAEDAFQATFLVLVRKAGSIQDKEKVANWLFGVAYQTAVRLRAIMIKQGVREKQVAEMPELALDEKTSDRELLAILDRELNNLPERYRTLIVLCELEGRTRKDVAQQLSCPEGTVGSGLARAKKMLAKRMSRYGIGSSVSLATLFSNQLSIASTPAWTLSSTIEVACQLATKPASSLVEITPTVANLTEEVVKTMFISKLKSLMGMFLVSALLIGGSGVGITLLAAQKQSPSTSGTVLEDEKVFVKNDRPQPEMIPFNGDVIIPDGEAFSAAWVDEEGNVFYWLFDNILLPGNEFLDLFEIPIPGPEDILIPIEDEFEFQIVPLFGDVFFFFNAIPDTERLIDPIPFEIPLK
jgi:RNA polymerase sigma factor (sigma-70 family)